MDNLTETSSRTGVSIILALGHDSEFIGEALNSVREQTHANWELIIVDNGASHPETAARLIADDPRMSMVTIDHFATAGRARNVGVAKTTRQLVTFLDDDDIWAPERLVRHVERHLENPLAPASFSGYWHMNSGGEHFGKDWRSRQTPATDILRGAAPTPLGPTLMIRREAFAAIGGHSPEVPILVDFELGLRLALLGDLIYIDELLVGYRRHSSNMTSTAPDNVRLRRQSMNDMIQRQRRAALGRKDPDVAMLFAERLARFRRSESRSAGVGALRQLRRGQWGDALKNVGWGISRAPGSFICGIIMTLVGRLVPGIRGRH